MSEDEGLRVEAAGETVGEAKWGALRELERLRPGLDRSAVRFQVVSEGERGLLGVGYAPARVVASVPAEALAGVPPAQPRADLRPGAPLAEHVQELVERITEELGVECRVDVREEGDTVVASCTGRELGMLIGRHGQTIDAVQYVVNAITARAHGEERKDVVVDAAGYRARRQATLEALADRAAERVRAGEGNVALEPMTAVERKIVHKRLQDVEGVATRSEGTEPNRYVVLAPAGDGEQ